jgi:hypothetical protein
MTRVLHALLARERRQRITWVHGTSARASTFTLSLFGNVMLFTVFVLVMANE